MINHIGTKTLYTKRLILKKDEQWDIDKLWDYLFSDKDAVKRCKWKSFENKEIFINSIKSINLNDNEYVWTIWLKNENIPIGGISVHSQDDDNEICKIGYSIHPKYWNKGYASESLEAVLNYMLQEVGYKKVITECLVENSASKKVMEHNNMIFEDEREINDNLNYIYFKTR